MPFKRKNFTKTKRVKAVARERIGSPPPARALPPKSSLKPKHKQNFLEPREE